MANQAKSCGLFTVAFGLLAAGCPNPEVGSPTFFDQRILPILESKCVNNSNAGTCHTESTEIPGMAMGNLDLSSFEAVHRRPELLSPYGSYPHAILLIKAAQPSELLFPYRGEAHQSEIFHAGGAILSQDGEAFVELEQWLRNGATRDGIPPDDDLSEGTGTCRSAIRPDAAPFLNQAQGPSYDQFKSEVQPILREQCSFLSCHGSGQADFYLTCGDDEEQIQQNYVVSRSFVSPETDRSELLTRPLSPNAGGLDHSGGENWGSATDPEFKAIREWAAATGPLDAGDETPEYGYFRDKVMPVLLRRGCAMPHCHSPHGFNSFRLRGGSRGFFSPLALRRDYAATRAKFVSLDTPDPNESRLLKKNIAPDRGGIAHRAGIALLSFNPTQFDDQGGNPDVCPEGDDDQPSSYCTIVEWIRRERTAAIGAGLVNPLADGDTVPIVYVDRPPNPDRVIEFANYRGDARLMRVDATVGPLGTLVGFSPPTPIDLSDCTGAADYDVRGPEVSYEADRMVFALRAGESDGLDVYESDLDGSACVQLTSDGGQSDSGVPIHNFDPVYAPDDAEHNPGGAIVFASTRPGSLGRSHVSPRYRLPASNIWRMDRAGEDLVQITFLNGSELSPAFMQNGKVTMTTEKATSTFYQLSGRRINWDLTDYHPLLAQRSDSIGFEQATEIREGLDRNFLIVLSNDGAWFSGGALATFNRSIGPFEDYRVGEPGYLGSVAFIDPGAANAGRSAAQGAYRSPFSAPDGSILVSYAAGELDLTNPNAAVDFDLVVIDPVTRVRTMVAGNGDGRFQVEGVVGYARAARKVFENEPQLVFGGTSVGEAAAVGEAWANFLDLPMLATLLTDNHRGDRGLGALDGGDTIAVYAAAPPPAGDVDDGGTFQSWDLLGTLGLEADGSAFIRAPAGTPLILELRQGTNPLLTMTEEHQFGPGEMTNLGLRRDFFNGVCGGCHGSVDGPELEVVVNVDALTGSSISLARPTTDATPAALR